MVQYRLIDRRKNTEDILSEVDDRMAELHQAYMRRMVDAIVDRSPVDTGTYMDGHSLTTGGVSSAAGSVSSHRKPRGQDWGAHAEAARGRLMSSVAAITSALEASIFNTAYHARMVEYGWAGGRGPYAPYSSARALSDAFAAEAVAEVSS